MWDEEERLKRLGSKAKFGDDDVEMKDEEEKKRIAKLCLLAGRKAKGSTSYDLAVSFLSMARSLIGRGSWDEEYKLNFDVVSELGECLYLNGTHDKAENCFHEVMQYARSRFEKLQILYVHSSLYLKEGNTKAIIKDMLYTFQAEI